LSGEEAYSSCGACHNSGIAGAPKLGDTADWSARISQGTDLLYDHAINGFQGAAGMMPAKGGNMALSDDSVKAAVDYMIENSQ
jgi:cytochrome c5